MKINQKILSVVKGIQAFSDETPEEARILKSITYYLCVNRLAVDSLRDVTAETASYIHDNLYINNGVVSCDNLSDYYIDKLNLSTRTINAIKKGKKILLLNYYHITNDLQDCRMLFNTNYKIGE